MNKETRQNNLPLLFAFLFSFFVWIVCFWGFISGKLGLTSDAISYYNHTKFFVDNLARGVYPLWDPHWHNGAPNEFFLRRIGSFNPLYFFMALLVRLGAPFFTAYIGMMVGYYFLGCIGFYHVAKSIFKDRLASFCAFLLLLFSSLGTRIFDSFIVLEFVPMVWFFAFLLLFFNGRPRLGLLGAVFSMMILMTTYIPFYFVNIVMLFCGCFILVYCKLIPGLLRHIFVTVKKQKWLSIACLVALLISLAPGVNLLKSSGQSEIALSKRHAKSDSASVVSVAKETITEWGIEEDLFYSYSFKDLKRFKFAIFYIPVFFYLLLGLGLIAPLSRKLIFFFLWGLATLAVFSPYAPVYDFLHKHVFYFKYFRNLHFYLWWIILPVVILFSCELLRALLKELSDKTGKKGLYLLVILLVHAGAFILAWRYHYGAISTYGVIVLSGIFFLLMSIAASKEKSVDQKYLFFAMLVLIVLQPLELYQNLAKNSKEKSRAFTYDQVDEKFHYTRQEFKGLFEERVTSSEGRKDFHYVVKAFEDLVSRVDQRELNKYLYHKLIVSDSVMIAGFSYQDFRGMSLGMILNHILTYVAQPDLDQAQLKLITTHNEASTQRQLFTEDSVEFQVTGFDANTLKLRTNFKDAKFLVYNDNYHSSWKAYVDGKETPIYRANFSFKGMWIPAGAHEIVMKFGSVRNYVMNIILLIVFYGMFALLLVFAVTGENKALEYKSS